MSYLGGNRNPVDCPQHALGGASVGVDFVRVALAVTDDALHYARGSTHPQAVYRGLNAPTAGGMLFVRAETLHAG